MWITPTPFILFNLLSCKNAPLGLQLARQRKWSEQAWGLKYIPRILTLGVDNKTHRMHHRAMMILRQNNKRNFDKRISQNRQQGAEGYISLFCDLYARWLNRK